MYDAIVMGGGFYGVSIAIYLVTKRNFKNVILIEKEGDILNRASYNNQARIHNGYHYPRSYTTAFRSRCNFPAFVEAYPDAVISNFTKLYAIARKNSKITAKHFTRFCHEIGAEIETAPNNIKVLFEPRLIEDIFIVKEFAFDSHKLKQTVYEQLISENIAIQLNSKVTQIENKNEFARLSYRDQNHQTHQIAGRYVFNCCYSGLNQLNNSFISTNIGLKHELTEIALVKMPDVIKDIGITLMDGPFFSMMPFPSLKVHSLSHVRYTPHLSWMDESNIDPYQKLAAYQKVSRADLMVRDIQRYFPAIQDAVYQSSLFEVKTVLQKNEIDDGRPILFERYESAPNCYAILGGKIDNIFDVIQRLDREDFGTVSSQAQRGIS